MKFLVTIFLALQIIFINNNTDIKEPYIETFEQINDQVWYPFIESYQNLDTDAFINLHHPKLVRMVLNDGMQYDIDTYFIQQKEVNDHYKTTKKTRTIELRFQHRTVQDSFAYEIGYYKSTSYVPRDPKGTENYGKFNVILKKENGTWKILSDADHGPVPSYLFTTSKEMEDFEPFKGPEEPKRRYR
jgi:ketosteroid isomerase-like protein